MELRDIEIFLTLAQELHFGRTAERLRLTPARISQSIKKQERRIGTPLFERTTRSVRLTAAGRRLYHELDAGYRQIMDGIESAANHARTPSGTLTIGTAGPQTWMVTEAIDNFQAQYPAVKVIQRDINPFTPFELLRSGDVDVAHLWLPLRQPDITIGPITHSSGIILMLADTHPYADRESVGLEDYGDLLFINPMPGVPSAMDATMEEAFLPCRTPAGRKVRRGPEAFTWEDELKAAVTEQAVITAPAEYAQFYSWPGLTSIPVRDATPVRWAFVWRTDRQSPLINAFAEAVRVR
ncbi:LysR family transcriptional regulator [Nocardia concava]|uniref:LysR family transcriptional regulator n=1 Tax=Nocardia concava TaxID=257281 RepID=UPI0002EA8799|nr:LysR substrate-binding domain-containing protein [Nocardia concava]